MYVNIVRAHLQYHSPHYLRSEYNQYTSPHPLPTHHHPTHPLSSPPPFDYLWHPEPKSQHHTSLPLKTPSPPPSPGSFAPPSHPSYPLSPTYPPSHQSSPVQSSAVQCSPLPSPSLHASPVSSSHFAENEAQCLYDMLCHAVIRSSGPCSLLYLAVHGLCRLLVGALGGAFASFARRRCCC